MKKCKFLLLVLVPCCCFALHSFGISGRVTDAATGLPVAAASVFISNSTYAEVCDNRGFFELKRFPPPPFELSITAIGYGSTTLTIDAGVNTPLSIQLKQKITGLDEVTVMSAEKDGWAKHGALFMEEFIGYSPFAARCELLNKEVLQFRYDRTQNCLHVWADEPLRIRNNATGYMITYWLDHFEKNFSSKKLYFKGLAQFAALDTKKEKKIREWTGNRKEAYYGSLNHFMRAVYKGNPLVEGFEIRALRRIEGADYGKYVPVWTDTIAFNDSMRFGELFRQLFSDSANQIRLVNAISGFMQWKDNGRDTIPVKIEASGKEYIFAKSKNNTEKIVVSYYDPNRLSPEDSIMAQKMMFVTKPGEAKSGMLVRRSTYDIVYRPVLNLDTLISDKTSTALQFRFPEYLQVTYIHEKEETAFLEKRNPFKRTAPDHQVSVISLNEGAGITVYPNGHFSLSYDLLLEQYWSYEKLDKLLPLDYNP